MNKNLYILGAIHKIRFQFWGKRSKKFKKTVRFLIIRIEKSEFLELNGIKFNLILHI